MSTRNILGNTEGFKSLSNRTTSPVPTQEIITAGLVPSTPSWYRNPSWLPLPTVTASEQKFVGLYAVYPDANFIALTAQAAYTVDWGDGTIQNFNNGVQANYEYSFSDADLNNTNAPVTFQDTGDTVTRNNHGYTNGMTLSFSSITTTTGIVAGQIYFVVGATTNTFQVAATSSGAALSLTNDGTGIILPYKQVIVTVTPQAGQTISNFNLSVRHSTQSNQYVSGWLDYALSFPNCTTLSLGTSQVLFNQVERVNLVNVIAVTNFLNMFSAYRKLGNVVQINLGTTSAITLANMFSNCPSLQTVPLFNTARVTNMSTMFADCTSLRTVPPFNTALVTNMSGMLSNCYALQSVPLFNTANVTDMSTMFNNCFSLQTVPLFDTAKVTTMSSMFGSCRALQTVPLFNTALVTNMSQMFNSCTSLQTVPLLNTERVTNTSNMFGGCNSLQTVPQFNTANVTNISSTFQSCSSLLTVPLFNTLRATNMSGMFTNCHALQLVPQFNTANVTNMDNMFNSCFSLRTVSTFNTANVTSMTSMFQSCTSLQTVPPFDTAKVTTIQSMFSSCTSLQTVPQFNTALVTNMQQTFFNCPSLQTVPLLNTANVTFFINTFSSCLSLQTVPALNANAVTSSGNLNNIFNNCLSLSQVDMTNIKFTFSVASCKLSAAALNNIYTNLPTVSGQTITVTGNYGVATDNPAIAQAKGWTVSG